MTNEIFEIMNDADEVMENVDYDPFGMNVVIEGVKNANLNSLTAKDLQDPEKLNMVKAKIASIDSADGLMNAYSKVNKLLTLGGAGVTAMALKDNGDANLAGALTIGNAVLGMINKRVKKSVAMKEYNEIKKLDVLLKKAIADMKKAQSSASKEEKDRLQDSIDRAEQMQSYIASKQDQLMNRHA